LNQGAPTDRRIGMWSAMSVAVLGGIYVCVGGVGVLMRPAGLGPLVQVDPYLAVLEFLIILTAVALVAMMAAVHACASPANKTRGLVAFAFVTAFALLTCSTHFASLTVGRQIATGTLPQVSRQLSMVTWPTIALALDLLAWDFFLGLSLLWAAPIFRGDRQQDILRLALFTAGLLCLIGVAAPISGHMWLQVSAIVGYAFVLPVACILLARVFSQKTAHYKE
jgi:hypothetical protein